MAFAARPLHLLAVLVLLLPALALSDPPPSPAETVEALRASLSLRREELPDPGEALDAARRKALLKADAALALPPADLAAACKGTGKAAKAVAKTLTGDPAVDGALADAVGALAVATAAERDAYEDAAAESLVPSVAVKAAKTLAAVDASLAAAGEEGLAPATACGLLGKAAKKLASGRKALEKSAGGPPAEGRLFVLDSLSSRVHVYDVATGSLIESVNPLAYLGYDVIVDPALSRNRVYALGESDLLTLDARTLQVIGRAEGLYEYGGRHGTVLGDRLYIAAIDGGSGAVLVRNLREDAWETPFPVGYYPDSIASDPVDGRLWLNGFGTNTVQIVDAETGTILGSPSVGQYPQGIALDPVGRRAFTVRNQSLPEPSGTYLVRISMDTLANTGETWLGTNSYGGEAVVADVPRRRLYVLNLRNPYLAVGNLVVLDLDSLAVLDEEVLGNNPKDAAVDPLTGKVYISREGGVDVYDPGTGGLGTPLAGASGPWGLSLVRTGGGN